jgi:hypothetical protein
LMPASTTISNKSPANKKIIFFIGLLIWFMVTGC